MTPSSHGAPAPSRFGPCPECGEVGLRPVSDGEEMNFLCPGCGLCWHWELNWIRRVDPFTCPGCPHRLRCLSVSRKYGRPSTSSRPATR